MQLWQTELSATLPHSFTSQSLVRRAALIKTLYFTCEKVMCVRSAEVSRMKGLINISSFVVVSRSVQRRLAVKVSVPSFPDKALKKKKPLSFLFIFWFEHWQV